MTMERLITNRRLIEIESIRDSEDRRIRRIRHSGNRRIRRMLKRSDELEQRRTIRTKLITMLSVNSSPLAIADTTKNGISMIVMKSKTNRIPASRIIVRQNKYERPTSSNKRTLDRSTIRPAIANRIKRSIIDLISTRKIVDNENLLTSIAIEPEGTSATEAQRIRITARIRTQLMNSRRLTDTRRAMQTNDKYLFAILRRTAHSGIGAKALTITNERDWI